MPLKISYSKANIFSLAAQHNARPLLSNFRLTYEGNKNASPSVLRDIAVELSTESDLIRTQVWSVAQLSRGESIKLQQKVLQFDREYLFRLSDPDKVKLTFKVIHGEHAEVLVEESDVVEVLPADFWGGETREPELLAAFVKPNGLFVESLVKQASDLLHKNSKGSINGYQSNTREQPYYMAAALWNVIAGQGIAYVSPPPGFATTGQPIRLPADISSSKMAACLDLSILFASCLELMGLNTVIALTRTHAMVGFWLVNNRFPLLTTDDPMDLRKRIDGRDLILFESTMICQGSSASFLQASDHARTLISEQRVQEFVYVIDISQARARNIRPIPSIEDQLDEKGATENEFETLTVAPPLPPVRRDERKIEETPDTRIDTWQRRLLDLTKRNSLLSFRDRTSGIRIYCPDIGLMEDQLADGTTFTFQSSEESPINDSSKSNEIFMLSTGNSLHKEYALKQLDNKVLVANMPRKRLENTAVTLFRKAKNDLEEGGANTLFIALGMLKWKEDPRDKDSYKAPLILIPVSLVRRSAGASIKLRQIPEEDPIFNLTLIEFLQQDYEIDLSELREELPEDESGIDVALVWQIVRDKIAEQDGFEVVEECVIASFSFTKYLMWKDLRDRMADLKENPFVAHLVDNPQEAYFQSESFLKPRDLDKKVPPTEIYVPLNCDSSQMVAVEASAHPQDFVLEGPPGTGKSETIANIIVHNIAKGRKVLFVAEKIAALQVVYRRVEKINLDHLCLELHSNRANKKAVLDQLRNAATRRSNKNGTNWESEAQQLGESRQKLNSYVEAIHKKSAFGISLRDAIARTASQTSKRGFKLSWGPSISDCPFNDEAGLNKIREAAKAAGLAFENIAPLNKSALKPIQSINWSFAWQNEVTAAVTTLQAGIDDSIWPLKEFARCCGISLPRPSFAHTKILEELVTLTDLASSNSLGFAMGQDVNDRLERLKSLSDEKASLDRYMSTIGHGVSIDLLERTPADQLETQVTEWKNSWWKKYLARRLLNRETKKCGWSTLSRSDVIHDIAAARRHVDAVKRLSEEFKSDRIWEGWQTDSTVIREKHTIGCKAHSIIQNALTITSDPQQLLTTIKSTLIDNRDYLVSSKLFASKPGALQSIQGLRSGIEECKRLHIEFDESLPLEETSQICAGIIAHEKKLSPWVNWTAAKQRCDELKISELYASLEAGKLSPETAEEQLVTAFCEWLAPRLIDSVETLRDFQANAHDELINEFRELDERVAETTSEFVKALAATKTPDINRGNDAKDFATLSRELQKKQRHKPIRTLFADMGNRILDLCPCMMMSPLSVAQFLPADFNDFDLVVFDEASQIPTWDAVGAIARGKNVIVVGDPKQMPPTNFFNSTVDVDAPDEEDLESILDQALAARLPHMRLLGHYRSRHESLIAFSNSKYYENSLITYPSSDTSASTVTLRKVDGVYAKGRGRNNPIEAKAVVDEVIHRLTHPTLQKLSLGIVTLNSEQQRTIEDLLDNARRTNNAIEPFFHDSDEYDAVFVKNLESVQGDERDVILLSLGYGPTEPGAGSMSMNFGPLNKSGGERRLNVAITRATTEVLVFSSFDSSMIDLGRTQATAVADLKHYLEFAERGPIALAEQAIAEHGIDQFDSEFEEAVAWALRKRGWRVQTQVGVGKFRIDLGIINPDAPGLYLAGVECDGKTYHGSPTARDRDRTRHAVLENLGWQLIRLWSTDYFRDAESAIDKIDTALNECLSIWRESAVSESNIETSTGELSEEQESATNPYVKVDQNEGNDDLLSDLESEFSAADYYSKSHEKHLQQMSKEILKNYPCMSEPVLALEIANRHGLYRTSKKQLAHLRNILNPWAGIWEQAGKGRAYWLSPEDVESVVKWRGLAPFGDTRTWREIAYPERLGLATLALEQSPDDPVGFIFDTFQLQKRHERTELEFAAWLDDAKQLKSTP